MVGYHGRGVHMDTVQALGQEIVAGIRAEGETLDVAELGRQLDVSATALREALRVLAAKGLVDARQRRGTFVLPRSEWNLLDGDVLRWQFRTSKGDGLLSDLSELRIAVEPTAARMAARRRTPDDLDALDSALTAMASADGDAQAAAHADLDFHRALLTATGNEMFVRIHMLLEPGLVERDLLVHQHNSQDDPVPSHRAVLEAIRQQDPNTAEQSMRALLAKAEQDLHASRPAAHEPDQ
jgi:GntR family transcriptional regulator, galactonate operon transcriptional repressor